MLSAFVTLASSGTVSNRPLHAVLCLAENSVASHAMRPDDVITLHSGKTVEVNNTDAEGRLVLSDGVSSAIQYLNPQVIIDMATLTGAQGVATGKYFGAIYTNNEELEKLTVEAGRESGDLCHPMPYAPEFFRPEFTSAVAGKFLFRVWETLLRHTVIVSNKTTRYVRAHFHKTTRYEKLGCRQGQCTSILCWTIHCQSPCQFFLGEWRTMDAH